MGRVRKRWKPSSLGGLRCTDPQTLIEGNGGYHLLLCLLTEECRSERRVYLTVAGERDVRFRVSDLFRVHTTRLETRTEESIQVCEYVISSIGCAMNVAVGT